MGKKLNWPRHHRLSSSRRSWDHDHPLPKWAERWHTKRRRLVWRLLTLFGFTALLVLGGMAALAFLLARLFGGDGQSALLVWLAGCGLSLALPLLAGAVATRAFRRIANPLAEVMAAADAVAEGDLSVRVQVPERGPGEFGRLAESFNRMAEELEQAERRRRNLTADVAHELRTPLQIIQGNLEGILDGVYEPTGLHIGATLDETRALARLVEDLRTLSLAEAGQLPLNVEPVDVAELLADVQTSFSGQAEAAGIDLGIEIDSSSDLMAHGDVGRLSQVLNNLVANALRHTPCGGTIRLRAEPMDGGARITVQDTGEGITSEDLPYIFDRFWRGDRSRSRSAGTGSGLGLAIAHQLVQAHHGRISVDSQVGEGTTFTVTLPADVPDHP
jgi:two-component system sensor histidine kinase BaeS